MHLPAVNVEFRPPILHQFIRDNPLGILTTAIRTPSHPYLQSSHIPWIVDSHDEGSESQLGRLRGHIARQNPQSKAIIEYLTSDSSALPKSYLEEDVLVLFNGPAHHYITPQFYTGTKPATGKVVPTWDYEAVEVYGKAKIYFDAHSEESICFLTKQIGDLSHHAETTIMGYGSDGDPHSHPWSVDEAPTPYVALLRKNIIGIEIEIKAMAGRFKMSQEKPKEDREGVIEGFRNMGTPVGAQMADLVRKRAVEFDTAKAARK